MSEIVMGGYPFGGSRFESITITEGKVQSINKDAKLDSDNTFIYVDLSGQPGSSGSGVINKKTGKCEGIFAGAAIGGGELKLTINYMIPIQYFWNLIREACLDQSYLDRENGECPIICNFDNIIEFVINNSHKYDGVEILCSNKNVTIYNAYLLNVYKVDKIMTNKKRMINLLEKLSESEIKYVGELNYKIICKVYFEGMNPSQIKDELHLTSKIISDALDKGYSKLKKIVKSNY